MGLFRSARVAIVLVCCGLALQSHQRTTAEELKPVGPPYSLPYSPGSAFVVGQGYLEFPTHEGSYAIDWTMPEETPIMAARDGVVIEAVGEYSKSGLTDDLRDKGNRIIVEHDDGTRALYWHLAHEGVQVKVGQRVKEGEQISLSGNTGYSATPHLHFMVYKQNGNRMESFPVLFKSGEEEPFSIVRGAKYRAPGGAAESDDGPLKGVEGTGELASIRPTLVSLVKETKDPEQAATNLKRHLLKNRAVYNQRYKETLARSQAGDKSAMKELQTFLDGMDLHTEPAIARLLVEPTSAGTANEAMLLWWELFSPK